MRRVTVKITVSDEYGFESQSLFAVSRDAESSGVDLLSSVDVEPPVLEDMRVLSLSMMALLGAERGES